MLCVLAMHGGMTPAVRRRAPMSLTLAEREGISRGVAAGRSIRSIAGQLGRALQDRARERVVALGRRPRGLLRCGVRAAHAERGHELGHLRLRGLALGDCIVDVARGLRALRVGPTLLGGVDLGAPALASASLLTLSWNAKNALLAASYIAAERQTADV